MIELITIALFMINECRFLEATWRFGVVYSPGFNDVFVESNTKDKSICLKYYNAEFFLHHKALGIDVVSCKCKSGDMFYYDAKLYALKCQPENYGQLYGKCNLYDTSHWHKYFV